MTTTKLYLDTRYKKNEKSPIKIGLTKHGSTSYYSLNIKVYPYQWDKNAGKIIEHENKYKLNNIILNKKTQFDNILLELEAKCETGGLNATQIKNKIASIISPEENTHYYIYRHKEFIKKKQKESTQRIYQDTLDKILDFDKNANELTFEDLTKDWLDRFENFLRTEKKLAINTISIHLRNIRAIVNDAIDNDITQTYSFRKKKIKHEPTRKRSLSVSELRNLLQGNYDKYQQRYVDTFKLCFCLIGLNIVDLCRLNKENIIKNRIEYIRAKTGKKYSIKIEPEAKEIIEKYKGENLLFGPAENFKHYRFFASKLDRGLKNIKPGLSIYWARHTWATLAASLDIPKETIAAALGHSIGNETTSIYIDFNTKKIDEANRRVIDYVCWIETNE